jgi:hypothetical protein
VNRFFEYIFNYSNQATGNAWCLCLARSTKSGWRPLLLVLHLFVTFRSQRDDLSTRACPIFSLGTLLAAIAGMVKPHAGEILAGGCNLLDLPPEARGLGMVF